MNYITDKKRATVLMFLFMATYMVSYITRINYSAIIVEIVNSTGYTKDLLSLALTGSFVTYGVGQIISGMVGDKVEPKKLILIGFIVTVLMNTVMIFCVNPYQMLVVWCVNGFAQAFMWPPLVRIMTSLFTESDYKRASNIVSWGSSIGTMIVYLAAFLIIKFSGLYQLVFAFSVVCGIIMIFVWVKFCPRVEIERKDNSKFIKTIDVKQKQSKPFPIVFIFIMLAVVLQGMLRDGVSTWMPSYIDETYNLGSAMSILSGVILPIFSILCFNLVSLLYKKVTNPLTCATIMFATGVVSSLALVFVPTSSAILSILFMAVLTGAMHGVNLMLICMVPPMFKSSGKISTVSGILNSCTYVGSAIFTYGIALISEKLGWDFTLIIWLMIALAGTLICALCIKPWQKQQLSENS